MFTIRDAQPEDAGEIAPLIDLIYDEMELEELEEISEPALAKAITAAYRTDEYLFEKASTVVAEVDGQVVGVVFGYPSENEPDINRVLYDISKKLPEFKEPYVADNESSAGEWYLDSLAVSPKYQGQGVGTMLLDAVPHMALDDGKSVIGLNVDFDNPNAKRLYEKWGYTTVGTRMIGDHLYYHMQKSAASRDLVYS